MHHQDLIRHNKITVVRLCHSFYIGFTLLNHGTDPVQGADQSANTFFDTLQNREKKGAEPYNIKLIFEETAKCRRHRITVHLKAGSVKCQMRNR
jgi:hypothetical protein